MAVTDIVKKPEGVSVVAAPHPFKVERVNMVVPDNNSLDDILVLTQPDAGLRTHAPIMVNGGIRPGRGGGRVLFAGELEGRGREERRGGRERDRYQLCGQIQNL